MKNAKKYLVVSIVTLVLAVAIATSSTFAWFAMTSTPSVEDFELTVTGPDGVLVGPEAAGPFAISLNLGTVMNTVKLDAVTPADPNLTQLNMIDGRTEAQEGSYYKFDVFFLAEAVANVFLDTDPTTNTVTTKTMSPKTVRSPGAVVGGRFEDTGRGYNYSQERAVGAPIDAEAALAARIGAKGDTNGRANGTVIYDPNTGGGWESSTTDDNLIRWTSVSNGTLTGDDLMSHAFYNSISVNDDQVLKEAQKTEVSGVVRKGGLGTTVEGFLLTTLKEVEDANDEQFGLMYNYYGAEVPVFAGKVTMYVWLEGKDADCLSSIYEDIMNVSIGFLCNAADNTP